MPAPLNARAALSHRLRCGIAAELLDSIGDCYVAADDNWRIVYANQTADRDLSSRDKPLLGTNVLDLFPSAADAVFRETLQHALAQKTPVAFEHFHARLHRWFDVQVSRFPCGSSIAFHDITTRRLATQRLHVELDELRRRNAELQDFAYTASHDLQEPLRKITAFGNRLRERHVRQLDDTGQDYLRRITTAAARMSTLIDGLLRYSRLATPSEPFGVVDLTQVAFEVLMDLETRIEAACAHIEIDNLPKVIGDHTLMRQLLQNLIGNAVKFRRPDVPPVVRVRAGAVSDGWCDLTVEDNGIGFDEAHLHWLFRPFHRLHGRGEYEGNGMGLAICRRIAEAHGGSITARSQPGHGSTFRVRLRVDPPMRDLQSPARVSAVRG